MKVAALIFCTHTHPCNVDMNIKNIVVLWFTFVVILVSSTSARIQHEICLLQKKKVMVGGETRHCR